jgi:hypothetical protein
LKRWIADRNPNDDKQQTTNPMLLDAPARKIERASRCG